MANGGSLSFEATHWRAADNLRGSRPIADTIEVLLRAKGRLRAIELTGALEDAAKLLPTDSASATLHETLAEMEGSPR